MAYPSATDVVARRPFGTPVVMSPVLYGDVGQRIADDQRAIEG